MASSTGSIPAISSFLLSVARLEKVMAFWNEKTRTRIALDLGDEGMDRDLDTESRKGRDGCNRYQQQGGNLAGT